jgi:hypothetical protein
MESVGFVKLRLNRNLNADCFLISRLKISSFSIEPISSTAFDLACVNGYPSEKRVKVSNFHHVVPPNFLNTVPLDFHDRVPADFHHVVPRHSQI